MRCLAISIAGGVLATCLSPKVGYAGAMVTANVFTSAPFAALGNKGTTELRAFSQEFNQTNQTFFGDLTSGGMAVNPAPNGAVLPNIQNISVMGKNGIRRYVPVVGLADQPKANIKQAGDIQSLISVTGVYQGSGNQFQTPAGRSLAALGFTTFTQVGPPPPGAAAGAAFDPISVPGASILAYSPTVDASIQQGDPSISGGLDIYAVDSTVFTRDDVANFLNDGSPFEATLWHLNLAANGPVAGTSDVSVDFELNPLALQEILLPSSYLISLPGYSIGLTNQQVALLIDGAVDKAITDALAFVGGTVSLQSFALFPDGTLFAPTNTVEYAEGVDAGLNAVPEPASISLLASGLFALFGFRRRVKRFPTLCARSSGQINRSRRSFVPNHS